MNTNENIKSDPFWYKDYSIIIQTDRLIEFFPTSDQTLEEKFNSLVRLSLYISIILFYYHRDFKYFSIFIGTLLLTYFIYINKPEKQKETSIKETSIKETMDGSLDNSLAIALMEGLENTNKSCTKPSIDNPFMNATMKDYLNIDENTQKIIERPEACDTTDPEIKQSMDKFFNHNLFKDVNDVFGKMNSQRQFYTMPSTTIPNAQDEFAKWLYLNPKTCKEDQEFCLPYEDVRAKRPVFVDPTQNPVKNE
jgi:hypothetical protein